MAGSVSGDCIEDEVFAACQEALATGEAFLLRFGVADQTAWEAGLACGGTIEVLIEPLREPIRAERPVATATVIRGPWRLGARLLVEADGSVVGSLGDAALDQTADQVARGLLAQGASREVETGRRGSGSVYRELRAAGEPVPGWQGAHRRGAGAAGQGARLPHHRGGCPGDLRQPGAFRSRG